MQPLNPCHTSTFCTKDPLGQSFVPLERASTSLPLVLAVWQGRPLPLFAQDGKTGERHVHNSLTFANQSLGKRNQHKFETQTPSSFLPSLFGSFFLDEEFPALEVKQTILERLKGPFSFSIMLKFFIFKTMHYLKGSSIPH